VVLDFSRPWHRSGPVFGDPRLAPYRLGQQSFKALVLDSYHRRCAISGAHIPPVLQAADIRAVTKGGEHRLDDGLLLRSDIHTMFDRGYLGVDPQHRLLISPRPRADFSNGDQFYAKAGQVIDLPERRATGGDGSHMAVEDAVSAQFRAEIPAFAKPTFERLRRARHSAQYFDPSAPPLSASDAAWAIEKAKEALTGARALLAASPPERFG